MVNGEKFKYINIKDFLKMKNGVGENYLNKLFSDFLCPKNSDVENFLKRNSIEFCKKEQSVTYLVFSLKDELVGYFSITIKPITIENTFLGGKSNKTRRKVERFSELDEATQSYTLSAYLVAQLGKNFKNGVNTKITGDELLELALTVIDEIKYRGGGAITFIETTEENKLLSFYEKNGFKKFSTKVSASSVKEKHTLIQMLKPI